jgi:molybdate transport system substrate-binding protein
MATIAVLTSLAIREAYLELVPGFERNMGHTVATVWAGTVDIQRRMAAGETCDLLMMSSAGLEEQARLGKVDGSTLRPMVKCGIGVAVRASAPRPDL